MYYNSEEIDEDLKCSVCKEKFAGVVRLIPDCGESVCEGCYENLKEDVDDSGRFKCHACTSLHTMPDIGLPDNKSLSRIIKRKKLEKPFSDEAKLLKVIIESFENKINALAAFDKRDFINNYCDQLEIEVIEEVESLMRQLNEIENELLKQISEYRVRCLDQFKDLPIHASEVEQELEALRKETTEFSAKWADFFNRVDIFSSEKEVADALEEANQFEKKIYCLQETLKSEALNGQIKKLVTKYSLFEDSSALRSIITLTDQDFEVKPLRIKTTATRIFKGHSGLVKQVLFLPDGRLASCSYDHIIIWDVERGTMLFKLESHYCYVESMALLSNGYLASGSLDNKINIWDLTQRKQIRTLEGHTSWIVSLEVLKNGNLASLSHDDTIKIWNPYSAANNLLLTITQSALSLGILSNQNMVTCSFEETPEEKSFLRIWNPKNGRLIKSISVNIKQVSSLLVLSNDMVALGSQDVTVKIVDPYWGTEMSFTIEDAKNVNWLAQLSNGHLLSCCEQNTNHKTKIQVWALAEGLDLIQTIITDCESTFSLSISHDETLLAGNCSDKSIILWPIN